MRLSENAKRENAGRVISSQQRALRRTVCKSIQNIMSVAKYDYNTT